MVLKMNKKVIRDLKRFSQIGTLAISTVVTIVLGVGLGLLLDKSFNKNYWTLICSLVFLIMAVVNFIYNIYKMTK